MRRKHHSDIEYIDEPEYIPVYKANREWKKDIKFNNHWYSLSSIYDDFDFNCIPGEETSFDFNIVLNEETD